MAKREYTLAELFKNYTVPELRNMAKELGLRGYSALKKDDVVALIEGALLDIKLLESKLLGMSKTDRELLEEAIAEDVMLDPRNYKHQYLLEFGLAMLTPKHEIHVPVEVVAQYNKITATKEYQEKKAKYELIEEYALACTNLYSLLSPEKLVEIITSQDNMKVTEEDVLEWCDLRYQLREESYYFYKDGYLMTENYSANWGEDADDYEAMLAAQEGKPYCVPEKDVLLNYTDDLYIDENESFKALETYLKTEVKVEEEAAYDLAAEIQLNIRECVPLQEMMDGCTRMGLMFPKEKQLQGFIDCLMAMYNNTSLRENCGYTANEMKAIAPKVAGPTGEVKRLLETMGHTETIVAGPKVYPNDPCPCKSGRKYKKCCGKN